MTPAKKPIESPRRGALAQRLIEAADARPAPEPGERLVIKSVGKTEVVPVADVTRIEAAGYYLRLHTRGRVYVHRESLRSLEARLPMHRFLRTHRSTLVNLEQIREARMTRTGEHELVLHDASRVPVSRSRWVAVSAVLKEWAARR
jgi:two-component system LytT family response regulator